MNETKLENLRLKIINISGIIEDVRKIVDDLENEEAEK